ncbi:MAG: class I SAM-dependent methyltransferase [Leptospiraceae bacterium]|nr:class I SAM-dependent methyltransferase [Leptospiraceae bacterium]MCP5501213.1 class I SAM-dependent methyltransferase [Leptospiraceae bacterium]
MGLWTKVSSQFGKPSGLLGKLAGLIMASRSSNIERSHWAVSMLNLQPTDRVLEIGFGPGIAIQKMSEIIQTGMIYGIDHSEVMLKQASKRNRDAISSDKVKLLLGQASNLPPFEKPLDKILDINSFQFWKNPVEDLKKIREHLKPEGMIALAHQPRKPGSTDEDALKAGKKFAEFLRQSGFKEVRIEKKSMSPVATVCVLGLK